MFLFIGHRNTKPFLSFKFIFSFLVLLFTNSIATADVTVTENPTSPESRIFLAAIQDLEKFGYTEKEYLVSGSANVYEYDSNQQVQVKLTDQPYTTRMIVRRPINPQDASGEVVLEWMNPTAGFDLDLFWHYSADLAGGTSTELGHKPGYIMREGVTYIGVTIKPTSALFLKFAYQFGGDRYATLNMTDLGQAYDLISDLAALLRDTGDINNPIADIPVKSLVQAGGSQSAAYLVTYANEFHTDSTDGYHAPLIWAAQILNNPIPQAIEDDYYADDRRFIREDLPAKFIRVQTETEVFLSLVSPDTNPSPKQRDNPNFRYYEVAGTAHSGSSDTTSVVLERDLGAPFVIPCANQSPTGEDPTALRYFMVSALDNLFKWTQYEKHGFRPAKMKRPISIIDNGGFQQIERNEYGNAVGGIRLPGIAAPLAAYTVPNESLFPGPNFCLLFGNMAPFSAETLAALYPKERKYLRKHHRSLLRNLVKGYILPEDAWDMFLNAEKFGTGLYE